LKIAHYPRGATIDFSSGAIHNQRMEIRGRVHQGVIVLEDGAVLPESAEVTVSCDVPPVLHGSTFQKRVEFPLVHSDEPGTLNLTGERIAEIFDEEDASALGYPFREVE